MATTQVIERSAGASRVGRIAIASGTVGNRITAALRSRLGGVQLTGTHAVLVLSVLALRGPLRPRDIQLLSGLTSGGTTNQLDRLAALRLVERSHDRVGGDRRAVVLSLAPEGRRVAELIAETFVERAGEIRAFLEELQAALFGDLPPTAPGVPATEARLPAGGRQPTSAADDRLRALESAIALAQLGTLIGVAMSVAIKPRDLVTNEMAIVMGALATGGPSRPRDLIALTGLSTGGMSKLLERLRAHGLVELQHGGLEQDRRATLVRLAPPGRRAMASISREITARGEEIRTLCARVEASLDA
jgi:DNA-binding MarR family transcriptional regulator